MEHIPYKYRIHYMIGILPHRDYDLAMLFLPELCKCTPRTFRDWMYRKEDVELSIPADAIVKLAAFFCVSPMELYNTPPSEEKISELYTEFKKQHYDKNAKKPSTGR